VLLTVKFSTSRRDGEFKHKTEGCLFSAHVGAPTATADSADHVFVKASSHGNVATTSSQASSWAGVMHGHVSKLGHTVVADSRPLNAEARASSAGKCACAKAGATMVTDRAFSLSGMVDMCGRNSGRGLSIVEMKMEDHLFAPKQFFCSFVKKGERFASDET